jgi:hypothetical protein
MSSPVEISCPATAPRGNVTRSGHKHVSKQNRPSPDVTRTSNSGEAG